MIQFEVANGHLAVNAMPTGLVVSFKVPDTLYVLPGFTDVGETARVNEVVCFSVL